MNTKHLVWFRTDLRTHDHPALFHSCIQAQQEHGCVIALCFITQQQWREHDLGERKIAWIKHRLRVLKQDLAELNIPLIILDTGTFAASEVALKHVVETENVTHLAWNHEYEVREANRDVRIEAWCQTQDICVSTFHDQCLIPPGRVKTKTGGEFKVFTPFKKAFAHALKQDDSAPLARPEKQIQSPKVSTHSVEMHTHDDPDWPCEEATAHQELNDFIEKRINNYHLRRDLPAIKGTSRLSSYLSIGLLSPRQCFYSALQHNEQRILDGQEGAVVWLSELIWREFYRHLIVANPHLCKHQPFKPETQHVPWRDDDAGFKAWCEGKTGYPIVDAAMRQLQTEGWMHNRLRMISAMFLTKHLLIDWRRGEAWFNQWLMDADLASNNGGWQWSASTGADGAPYFRVFNPTTQSRRFDGEGRFIKKYLPELSTLDKHDIHEPSSAQRAACHYPEPIVEHKSARLRAIEAFKHLPKG